MSNIRVAYVNCPGITQNTKMKIERKKPHVFLDVDGSRICPDCGKRGSVAWYVIRKEKKNEART